MTEEQVARLRADIVARRDLCTKLHTIIANSGAPAGTWTSAYRIGLENEVELCELVLSRLPK